MSNKFFWHSIIASLVLFSCSLFACDVTDDMGNKIHVDQPAQRVISLAPDITENIFAIGAGAQLVGSISGSDYPLAAQQIPIVGSYSGIDLEKIVSLHPDLIIVWGNTFSRQIAALKQNGIPIYISQPQQLEDVPRALLNLGCLTGKQKNASQVAQHFSQRLLNLRKHYQQQKQLTVFYQIGDYSLFTISKKSWINQVISLCGGRNIFAEANLIAPEVSWEAVISANPQIIINSSTSDEWKKRWLSWEKVTAVKNHALFTINPDLINRAGPRLLSGAEQMCEYLQTQRFTV